MVLSQPAAQADAGSSLRGCLENGARLACRFGDDGMVCECDDIFCVSLLFHVQNLIEHEGDSPQGLMRQRLGSGRALVSVRQCTTWRPAADPAPDQIPTGWSRIGLTSDHQTALLVLIWKPGSMWIATAVSIWRLKHGDRPFEQKGAGVVAAMDHLRREFNFLSCCPLNIVSHSGCGGVIDIQDTDRLVRAGCKLKTMSSCGMEHCFGEGAAREIVAKLMMVAEARPPPDFVVLGHDNRLMTSPQALRRHVDFLLKPPPPREWAPWKSAMQSKLHEALSRNEQLRKACREKRTR